jgi:hypothetical protein
MRYYWAIILFFFISLACNEGLAPQPEIQKKQEGFGGKIIFNGNWYPDVTRTHLLVFKNPIQSPDDFSLANIAFVSRGIPYGISEISYSTLDSAFYPPNSKLSAGTYSFIAVAQQTTPELTLNGSEWSIRGYFRGDTSAAPGKVTVPPDEYINNIDIYCIFVSPTP